MRQVSKMDATTTVFDARRFSARAPALTIQSDLDSRTFSQPLGRLRRTQVFEWTARSQARKELGTPSVLVTGQETNERGRLLRRGRVRVDAEAEKRAVCGTIQHPTGWCGDSTQTV